MGGRPRKPTTLKLLQGTDRPDRHNFEEPTPTVRFGSPPRDMTVEAKVEWRRMGRKLFKLGLLTELDHPSFALYCEAWAKWQRAEAQLTKFGMVLIKDKFPKISPYYHIANAERQAVIRILSEFGMTPSSRSRIHVAPKQEAADPFESYISASSN